MSFCNWRVGVKNPVGLSQNTQNHTHRLPIMLTDLFLYLHAQTRFKTFIYPIQNCNKRLS